MSEPASFIGETVGHYRVLGKLGAGGMGVVYKALDLTLQRTVGLKFLPADVALNEREKESLLQEARAASALDHPNIGSIYGIEEMSDHQLFIVMAYYEGETVAQLIGRGLPAPSQSVDLVLQIARGLSAAHARNIVHRDIKPSNVILTKDGVAKIVDFGLARVVTSSALTQSMHISGTLPYMAPEQILGESLSPACDVWALGVILIQIFTGSHPFFRDNAAAMTFAILNQAPAGIESMPPELGAIAYRALAKTAENRYPTAKEMQADLEPLRSQGTSRATVGPNEATRTNLLTARELKHFAELASAPRWAGAAVERKTPRRSLYVLLALLTVALATLLVPQVRTRLGAALTSSSSAENHIAVLPFDNIGGDPANDALAAGLMDALSGELSNINAGKQTLWVVPASVVRSHKVSDPTAAAKELGVNLVVKGSIQRTGQDVRLTVDLIDANNLRQIGSVPLEDRTGDIGTLQNEAVARLASLMKIKVSAEELRATGGRASPAAYELYLQALGYMQRYDKPGNIDQAISALNDAVKIDPQFALGFASLGEAYRLKNQVDPQHQWVEQSLANLNHAVEVDDRLASPFVSLGRLHTSLGKHDLALQEFQKALAVNPRDADAIMGMASAYEHMGRLQDAEANFKKAIALRPDYWDGYNSLGFFYFRQQRFPEAIAQFRRVLELTPDNATAYSNLAAVYLSLSDPKAQAEGEAPLKRSIELSPTYAAYANLGRLYFTQKRYSESAQMSRKALELNGNDYNVWNNLFLDYQWLHDDANIRTTRTKTLALLEDYVKLHPQDAEAHSTLSNLYAEEKEKDKAERQIETALALQPKDGSVLADAAESYEDLGDRKRAIEFAEKSLQNGDALDDLQSRPALQALLADPNFHSNPKR
jgi:serine/threonine-protein kinase